MNRQVVSFTDVVRDVSGGNAKITQSEFATSGTIPIIDQGQAFIAGYTDDVSYEFRSERLPVVVFGDHTRTVKYIDFPFAMGADGVKVLKADDGCDPKYLYHFLQQAKVPDAGYSRHYKFVKELRVPLPSLGEQRRIAAILDKADALRAKRLDAIAKLDEVMVATFLELCGSPHGPPISIGRPRHRDADKYVPLVQVATMATGHTPSRRIPKYWGGEIPWIGLSDIRRLDGRLAEETEQCTTAEGIAKSSAVVLPRLTVCFSRTASVGFCTILGREMATSQDFVNWICGERINPYYLMAAFRASKKYLVSRSTGSTHKTIYFPVAERFHVFLPDLRMQAKFGDALIEFWRMRAALEVQSSSIDRLFASVRHSAFEGVL